MRRHQRRPGINRRLLDPAVRVARSPRVRGLAGGAGSTVPLRSAAKDGRARLPVDPTAAQLRVAASVVPSARVDSGVARLLAATADAGTLSEEPRTAHREGVGADERQAERG